MISSPQASKRPKLSVRRVRAQIRLVHFIVRHGDRTPITALKDSAFWTQQLPEDSAHPVRFKVLADEADSGFLHCMAGAAPFGQLTRRGIEQLQNRGAELRKSLPNIDTVTCRSTYFTRTMQSAQHLLHGMGVPDDKVSVDTRNWRCMIPDGDVEAFRILIKDFKDPVLGGDLEWRTQLTRKLFGLGLYAFEHGPDSNEIHGIGLDRLAETLICLQAYDRLPPSINAADVQRVRAQMAAVHFDMLSQPELLRVTMGPFVDKLLLSPIREIVSEGSPVTKSPSVNIFSGHDTTLFGLLQALNLRPIQSEEKVSWQEVMCPNYADTLRLDLLEISDKVEGESDEEYQTRGEELDISEKYLDQGEKFFVRFIYDGHGPVAVDGYPEIMPAKLLKGIWEL